MKKKRAATGYFESKKLFFTMMGVVATMSITLLSFEWKSQETKPPPKSVKEEPKSESTFFTIIEENASYPGGEAARQQFLKENVKYPDTARAAKIEGTVYVTFVIERDGSISDVKVLRGIGGGCDEEAIRVVKLMPNWIPGKQRGKAVRNQFNMPINFVLTKEIQIKNLK
jgi:protein TonB